jgi:molybdopterin molybdotransferase
MTVFDRITDAGCGCSPGNDQPSLISIDEALGLIQEAAAPVRGSERVALGEAKGRVLAAPVLSRAPLPPFDNGAMDGYAVATAGLAGEGPWRLHVDGRIPAGTAPAALAGDETAARILTGAPLPPGADAVVMQEEVRRTGDGILIRRRPIPGENIRRAGEDMAADALILPAGRTLGTREIAACASAGHGSVEVQRRLRVALVATGNEIAIAGEALADARIWDVNTPMLVAALASPSVDLISIVRCDDDRDVVRRVLATPVAGADLLVTTGGISVGDEDHVKPALRALGAEILFSGVAVKPGKPVSFGRIGSTLWLGLPGNPLSAFLTWTLFGAPLVQALAGASDGHPARRHVTTARAIRRKPGRCELRPARRVGFDGHGREVVDFEPTVNSARVAGLPTADGILFLPAEADWLPEGSLVDFLPFPTC